jgi:pimeloyl-ACP methyl ester carboxylesterase
MYFDVKGKQVFATTGGKPLDNSKPVVVFLHGSGLDHTFFNLQARFFAFRKYSVLVPDLPGHTHSEGPALTSIEAMAEWLNDVVEVLDIDNVSIVAHSMGCLTAMEYLSQHPDKVRSVTFITSGLATPVNPALIDAAENQPEKAIAMMLGWGFGSAGHKHQGPVPGNSMVAGGHKVMRGNVPTELATDLKACDAYSNGKTAAPAVKGPVQVILAGKDRMAPRKATSELIEHLNNPQVHVIEHSGHMIPQEAPDECRMLLRDFIFSNNPAS